MGNQSLKPTSTTQLPPQPTRPTQLPQPTSTTQLPQPTAPTEVPQPTPPPISPSRHLTINDLALILNTLSPVASNCYAIGLQLGVQYLQLETIDCNYRKFEDKLREIILERLKQELPLTWLDIVRALRSDTLRENRLATSMTVDLTTSMAEEFKSCVSSTPSSPSTSHAAHPSADHLTPPVKSFIDNPTPPTPPPRHLTINDLALIVNTLSPVASKCFALGLQLGVQYSQLQNIDCNYGYCEERLREIIVARLNQELPLTWLDIVRALRSGTVKENRLASEIECAALPHQCRIVEEVIERHTSQLTDAFGNDLQYFSKRFKEIGVIDKDAYDNNKILSGSHLLSLIIDNYHKSHDKKKWFDEFVAVFSHSTKKAAYNHLVTSMTNQRLTHFSSMPHNEISYVFPQQTTPTTPPHSVPQSVHTPSQSGVYSHLQNSMAFVNFIDYVKTFYRESEVERDTTVVKWPPTPSKVYINLVCIDRHSVSGRSSKYDEVTKAMVCDGNLDVVLNVTKGPIDFSDIAKNISFPNSRERSQGSDKRRLTLVEGAPGVGKSTFAWEFCRRWERGEIAQQYQLVLLLRLREERISNAKSLEDLIYHPFKDVPQAVYRELVLANDFHALIVLEGFDELPDSCRKSGSIFMDLIAGKLLPLATVLVTSRPWATQRIRLDHESRIYQHIEILGFTGQQITEYIESTLPQGKVKDLKAYLERHPQIRAGMYIPLNSAIVVTVYEESQASGYAMPTTLTELYTCLTQTLLLRYLRGHPEYEIDSKFLKTLRDLPPPVDGKFHKLCRLAYDGTVGTSDQVQLIFRDLSSDFEDLGLMDSVTELYVAQGAVSSHNFLHLTFQEFFAAVHISSMSPVQQVEHFKRHKEGRLKVVLRFLAGLNKLNCFSNKEIVNDFFQTPSTCEDRRYQFSCDAAVGINLVQWLFEAQSDDVIEHVLGQKTIEFELSSGMLPLDYYSLGYCISHNQCQWVLGLGKEEIGEAEVRMLAAGVSNRSGRVVELKGEWRQHKNHNATQKCEGTAREINVGLSIPAKCLNMLFTEWKSILHLHQLSLELPDQCDHITWPDLSALRVLEVIINGNTKRKLSTLLSHLPLESLTIVPARNGDSLVCKYFMAIGDNVKPTTHLRELYVQKGISDVKGVEAITAALASNQSLPLERLELECECTFTATAVDSLAQFIINTTTLQYLLINTTQQDLLIRKCTLNAYHLKLGIGGKTEQKLNTLLPHLPLESLTIAPASNNAVLVYEDCMGVGKHVTATTNLRELCISSNICDEKGVEAITAALASNQSLPLERLELECEFTFTATAVDSLAQFITNTTTLHYLSILWCAFSPHALLVLARAIHHNSILQTKTVKDFNLTIKNGDNEAKDFAQLLVKYPNMVYNCRNYNMERLNLYNKSISDAGAVALAQALHHNSTLTELDLSSNSICDAGAVALAQTLHHNSTLTQLHLSNNSISDSGAVALAQTLHHNSTLTQLHLSNNSISDSGAVALAQALHHNSTLTQLHLSNDNISDAGAVALAQALHHNSTLTQLYLSNDNISDAGAVALAHALHHNSTLTVLFLFSNDGVGEEGTRQLVQALTVNTSIKEHGLWLPWRCEEYATQCPQHHTVKCRIYFQ